MLAVLLAGLAGVRWFELRSGGATVPGLVLVTLPVLDHDTAAALRRRWPEMREETLLVADGPLEPFGPDAMAVLSGRGHRTALFAQGAGISRAVVGETWDSLVDVFPQQGPQDHATAELARFLRAQHQTRPFVAALVFGSEPPHLVQLLGPVVAELERMPWFRRSSLVVLGPCGPAGGRRVLRLDVGDWGRRARPELADLLDPRW